MGGVVVLGAIKIANLNGTVGVNKKFTFRIRSTIVVWNQFHSFYKRSVIPVKVRCKIVLQQLLAVLSHKSLLNS